MLPDRRHPALWLQTRPVSASRACAADASGEGSSPGTHDAASNASWSLCGAALMGWSLRAVSRVPSVLATAMVQPLCVGAPTLRSLDTVLRAVAATAERPSGSKRLPAGTNADNECGTMNAASADSQSRVVFCPCRPQLLSPRCWTDSGAAHVVLQAGSDVEWKALGFDTGSVR